MGIIKMNSSSKMNRYFSNKVSHMSIDIGVSLDMARNIVRWRRSSEGITGKSPKKLTTEQTESPSVKLARQIKDGTGSSLVSDYDISCFELSLTPKLSWEDAEHHGMVQDKNGVLLTAVDVVEIVKQDIIEQEVSRGWNE